MDLDTTKRPGFMCECHLLILTLKRNLKADLEIMKLT